jgi:hypothetical protein
MATVTKTWTFNSNNDGFTLTNFTRITTDGSPDTGCLENSVSGRNTTKNADAEQTLTYEDMGVPAGARVTGLSFKMRRRCVSYTGTISTFNYSVGSTPGTLFNQTNITGTAVWAEVTGNSLTGLNIASNTNCTITLYCNITTGGGGTVPNADARFDTLELTITYSAPTTLSLRSATANRSSISLNTKVGLSLRSTTSSRSEVELPDPSLNIIELSLRSSTLSISSIALESKVGLDLKSSTNIRSSVFLNTKVETSPRSTTDTRSEVKISTSTQLGLLSQTEIRSYINLDTKVSLSLGSITDTRVFVANLIVGFPIELSLRSVTKSISNTSIHAPVTLSLSSETGSRISIALLSKIGLSLASRTGARIIIVLDVGLVTTVYFQYRKVGSETWLETITKDMWESGDFDQLVTDLESGEYEFRAVAEFDEQFYYGEILTFNTSAGPPNILITHVSKEKISAVEGWNECEVRFKSTQDLLEWVARENGYNYGTGSAVGSGGALDADYEETFWVYYYELTQGDKTYRINVYGKNEAGEWTEYEE